MRREPDEEEVMGITWHEDWPAYMPGLRTWEYEAPLGDFIEALSTGRPAQLDPQQVVDVERYKVRYHGNEWKPGERGWTELEMFVLGRLTDGRWFTVEARNDYTGWGCRDRSDVTVHQNRDGAIRHGLTLEGRSALGVLLSGESR